MATSTGPGLPASVPPIEPAPQGLCVAQPVRSSPFMLEGAVLRFVGRQPVAGGQLLACDSGGEVGATIGLSAQGLGRAANVVLYPGLARRDFVGPSGTGVETLLAARTLPLFVWQIAGGAGDLQVEVALPGRPSSVDRDDRSLRIATDVGELVVAAPAEGADLALDDRDGTLRATVRRPAEGTTTVALAFGAERGTRAALAALSHLSGHALRAAAGPEDGLVLRTGASELDDAFAWARVRLAGRAEGRADGGLLGGLAAVATGDRETAHLVLGYLRERDPVAAALLAARMGSTFGDAPYGPAFAEILLGPERRAHPLRGLAAERLADALQHGAPPPTLQALRQASKDAPASPPAGEDTGPGRTPTPTDGQAPHASGGLPMAGGRSLPMAGGGNLPGTGTRSLPMAGGQRLPTTDAPGTRTVATPSDPSHWLAGLFEGNPVTPPDTADVRAARARRAGALFSRQPEAAWADWRALVDEGLVEGPGGPATWDAPGASALVGGPAGQTTCAAAELLLACVHGLLGLSPDAPVGRLRLAPRLPGHLTRFSVQGIPIGNGTIGLSMERTPKAVTFELDPERIAVPPLLVFEPGVTGRVERVMIDGEPASLDLRQDGAITVVPVQLPLDSVRRVVVETG